MRAFILLIVFAAAARAAEPSAGFLGSLSPEQRARLGLAGLTAAQAAALDSAVEAYARQGSAATATQSSPVSTAPARSVGAAPAAIADAPPASRSSKIAPAAPVPKAAAPVRRTDDAVERFTAVVVGPFRGWSGGTYFPLANGQVWRQVGTESNELPLREGAEVEIYQSKNGYWRLSFEGVWITVRRLQ
jgi:hypothetical protein